MPGYDFPTGVPVGTQVTGVDGQVYQWDGVKWKPVPATGGPPGDITAVIAGAGLTGGGTVGDVTVSMRQDVANVLDFGADPTSTADSTAAFQAAVATGRSVYIPKGHYSISDAITVNAGQRIYGDGPRASMLAVSTSFNMSAGGVFVLSSSTREQDVEIRDLWIRFAQPDFAGMARADIKQYPPGINSRAGNRAKLINLLISNAWTGIDYDGGGAGFLDRVEMSAYSTGLMFGATTPVLDGTHISNFHYWQFDLTANQAPVFNDGNNVAAMIGRIDGLVMSDCLIVQSKVIINDTAGTPGHQEISNLQMDGPVAQIIVNNTYWTHIANCYFSKSTASETPAIIVAGGRGAAFTNLKIDTSMATTEAVRVTGGHARFIGGATWWKESTGASLFTVSAGALELSGICVASHNLAHTAPIVLQSGTGILVVQGLTTFQQNMTGVAIQMNTATVGSFVGGVSVGTMTNSIPSSTRYTPIATQGGFTIGDGSYTGSVGLTLHSTGTRALNLYESNTLRWVVGAETAANNSDFRLHRFNTSGVEQLAPLTIRAQTGLVWWNSNSICNTWNLSPESMPAAYGWRPFAVQGDGSNTPAIEMIQHGSGGAGMFMFRRSTGSPGSLAAIPNNMPLGDLTYGGYDGTAWQNRTAIIRAQSTANWVNASAYDTALQFYVTAGTALTNPVTIASSGTTINQINVTTATGPNIRSGTGAATGTQPAGSLFLRTDGAAGSRLYVSAGGGTWAAVAGV